MSPLFDMQPFYLMFLVCADLIRGAKEKNLKVKGPVRMPTKVCTPDIYNGPSRILDSLGLPSVVYPGSLLRWCQINDPSLSAHSPVVALIE